MKKSFSQKMLALILAVLMLATSLPFTALGANLPVSQSGAYLMAYFKGDDPTTEKFFLALSKDGYHFEELNAGQPIPLDYRGTISGSIRDPFIMNADANDTSGMKYYVLATDMSAAKGWTNEGINVWAEEGYGSPEFTQYSSIRPNDVNQRATVGSLPYRIVSKYGDKTINRFWAPEVIWDPTYVTPQTPNGAYMMTFGMAFTDWSRGTRLYYAHTLDFKYFYDFDALFDLKQPGFNNQGEGVILDNIDSNIIYANGEWYMFFKNEASAANTNCGSRVFVTKSKTDKPYGPYYDTITDNSSTYPYQISTGELAFEGPSTYNIAGTKAYVVAMDNFGETAGNYKLYLTTDFRTFTGLSVNEFSLTTGNRARHASIIQISDNEYNALVAKYGKWTDTQTADASTDNMNKHLVARYFVDDANPGKDVSGNGNDIGTVVPGVMNNLATTVKNGKLCVDLSTNSQDYNGVNPVTSHDISEDHWGGKSKPPFFVAGSGLSSNKRYCFSRNYGRYATIETAQLLSKANVNTGVTIAFDALPSATGTLHVIDISNAKDYGYINKGTKLYQDGSSSIGNNGVTSLEFNNNSAAFNNCREVFVQMDETNRATVRETNKGKEYTTWFDSNTGAWHTYSITFTKGMITVYVDGVKVAQNKDSRYDEAWFNELFKSDGSNTANLLGKSKIGIGVSHWIGDYLFSGWVSNLCIYDRALSQSDIQLSNEAFLAADQIPLSQGRVIYEDLTTDEQFAAYDAASIADGDETSGYGKMLRLDSRTVASQQTIQDSEATACDTGYTISYWTTPGDNIDNQVVFRQGNDTNHFDIKENGIVEFKYGNNNYFTSDSLFTLEPNKIQNVTLHIVPYSSYDRIVAYVDGVKTAYYDAYRSIEGASGNNYPQTKTLLQFINNTNASVNQCTNVRYGDTANNTYITGVEIYRGAVDAKELYTQKLGLLASTLYKKVLADYEAKMQQFSAADNSTTLWKNMAPAYEAYDKLNRYVDSYTYGENRIPDFQHLSALTVDLQEKTEAMTPYSSDSSVAPYVDVVYNQQAGGQQTTSGVSGGVIYSQPVTHESGTTLDTFILGGAKFDGVNVNVVYNSTVFVYDGSVNDLKMPIAFKARRDKKTGGISAKFRYMNSAYPVTNTDQANPAEYTDNAFYLGGSASGTKKGWAFWNKSFAYPTNIDSSPRYEIGYDKANTGNYATGDLSEGTHFWYSCLHITPTALPAHNDAGTIQGVYYLNWNIYGSSTRQAWDNNACKSDKRTFDTVNKDSDIVTAVDTKNALYVIDVSNLDIKQQEDPTNVVRACVPSQQGTNVLNSNTARNVLNAVDTYTSLDSMIADEVENTSGASVLYETITSAISTAESDYNTAMASARAEYDARSGVIDWGYTELKENLADNRYLENVQSLENDGTLVNDIVIYQRDENGKISRDDDNNKIVKATIPAGETYTMESVSYFTDVYDEAVAHFTSLDPYGNNEPYSNRNDQTATNLVLQMEDAYKVLNPVANFDDIEEEVQISKSYTLGEGITSPETDITADGQQNFSLKSWVEFVDLQNAAKAYAEYPTDLRLATAQFVAEPTTHIVDRTQKSAEQIAIDTAEANLESFYPDSDSERHLTTPVSGDALQNYNTAQSLASRVDLDAYNDTGKGIINSNLDMGYVANGQVVRAHDFDPADPTKGVYVVYDGGVYLYADSVDDIDPATAKVLNGITAVYTVDTGAGVNMGDYEVSVFVHVHEAYSTIVKPVRVYGYGSDTGNGVVVDCQSYDDGNYDIARWTVKSESADKETIVKNTTFVLKRAIQQDTEVHLYLIPKQADKTKVTVIDNQGVRLDVVYVPSADFEINTDSDNNLLLPDFGGDTHTINPNVAANYTFKEWKKITDASTGEITLVAVCTRNDIEDYATYNTEGGLVQGSNRYVANYNTLVTFQQTIGDDFFAWIKSVDGNHWYVASYDGNFTTISAPTPSTGITYKAVTAEQLADYIADSTVLAETQRDKIPFSFGIAVEKIDGKFKLFCDYSVDRNDMSANVNIVQSGVLFVQGDSAPAEANFVKGADGVRTIAANSVSDYNTYIMSTANYGYMRSYVSYMYTTTDPRDPSKTVTVPLVAYGPIVYCDASGNITMN